MAKKKQRFTIFCFLDQIEFDWLSGQVILSRYNKELFEYWFNWSMKIISNNLNIIKMAEKLVLKKWTFE